MLSVFEAKYQYSMYSCYATIQFLVLSTFFIGLINFLAIFLAHSWFTAQIDALHLISIYDLLSIFETCIGGFQFKAAYMLSIYQCLQSCCSLDQFVPFTVFTTMYSFHWYRSIVNALWCHRQH